MIVLINNKYILYIIKFNKKKKYLYIVNNNKQ